MLSFHHFVTAVMREKSRYGERQRNGKRSKSNNSELNWLPDVNTDQGGRDEGLRDTTKTVSLYRVRSQGGEMNGWTDICRLHYLISPAREGEMSDIFSCYRYFYCVSF